MYYRLSCLEFWVARLAGLAGLLCLSGCSEGVPSAAPTASFDILEVARPVPLVAAQGVGLLSRVELGLSAQSVEGLHMATLTAEDFEGHPFVYLHFTAPRRLGSPWESGLTLTGQEWAGEGEGSPWSTSVVGASTGRALLSSTSVGLELLRNLSRTAQAMGGAAAVRRLVAASPSVFLLEDMQGRYWDSTTASPASAEVVARLRADYERAHQANNSQELLTALEADWQPVLEASDPGRAGAQGLYERMETFTRQDGSLDLRRAAAALRRQGVSAQVERGSGEFQESCWRFLWWRVCNPTLEGYLPTERQAHGTSFRQDPEYMGWPGQDFSMPTCVFNARQSPAPVGCGPASFIGLVWRQWKDGERFYGRDYNGEPPNAPYRPDSIAADMTAPDGEGRPRIASYMGSCYFFEGTLTTAAGFVEGGNAFLRDQGKQDPADEGSRLRLSGNYSSLAGNLWSSASRAEMLLEQLGRANNPVIAEYWRAGFLQGHYSPVREYRLVYLPGSVDVRVKTVDDMDGWYSLSDIWLLETGVYYLERY